MLRLAALKPDSQLRSLLLLTSLACLLLARQLGPCRRKLLWLCANIAFLVFANFLIIAEVSDVIRKGRFGLQFCG